MELEEEIFTELNFDTSEYEDEIREVINQSIRFTRKKITEDLKIFSDGNCYAVMCPNCKRLIKEIIKDD